MRAERRDALLVRADEVFGAASGEVRLLDAIAWPRAVEHEFFAHGARRQPAPSLSVDRPRIEASLARLTAFESELQGEHPMLAWLRALCRSHADAHGLVLATGTDRFYQLSVGLYGGARTSALDDDTTNLDLARHILSRLDGAVAQAPPARLDTDAFVGLIERKLSRRTRSIELSIVRDPELNAKVICGTRRLRVREGAHFSRDEAEGLYEHEVETHALTAQNGDAQRHVRFLRSGGPRATRTQEGLAVFAELYGHSLSSPRLSRLAIRVLMVGMAEDGASFLDVYRYLLGEGAEAHDAYLDVQRVFRGGNVLGGAPFTKDACYLAGLVDVYNFLRVAVRAGARQIAEVLVSGRLALADLDALLWLRSQGVLVAPRLVPRWLDKWDTLLAYFAFTSFLNEIDFPPVVARHQALLDRAASLAAGGD